MGSFEPAPFLVVVGCCADGVVSCGIRVLNGTFPLNLTFSLREKELWDRAGVILEGAG